MINGEYEKKGFEAERLLIEGLEDLECALDYNGRLDQQSKLDFVVYGWNRVPSYQPLSIGVQFTTYMNNEDKFDLFMRHIARRRPAVDVVVYLEVSSEIGREFSLPELVHGILMSIAFNRRNQAGDNFRVTISDDWRYTIRTFEEVVSAEESSDEDATELDTVTEVRKTSPATWREKYPSVGSAVKGVIVDIDYEQRRCYVEDSERRRYFLISRECGNELWAFICKSSEPVNVKFIVAAPINPESHQKPRATKVILAED